MCIVVCIVIVHTGRAMLNRDRSILEVWRSKKVSRHLVYISMDNFSTLRESIAYCLVSLRLR